MEISSSVVTGSMRVGLQIVSSHKRPVLEIYHQVRNIKGPEVEFHMPIGTNSSETRTEKHRFQDIFVQFMLINIGGVRAENIKLSMEGELRRNPPRESFGKIFDVVHPQLAPGQINYLFRFDEFDLYKYPDGGGKPEGMKDSELRITIEYDAPSGILNSILAIPSKLARKRRFKHIYVFKPEMVQGDLPPVEYA